jgi:transposase
MWSDSTVASKESHMATTPRRPQAHCVRQQLQARRLRAAELFAAGVHPAEVARQLGVSRQAASTWHAAWKTGGTSALASRGATGPTPRVSDQELARVEQALLQGATAHGFQGELWTLDRVAELIERLTGVRHHPAHVWALLRYRLRWTVQRPRRRAAERDQAAINHWVKTDWPRIKKKRGDARPPSASSTSPA